MADEQQITDWYAAYRGDCMEVMAGLPDDSIHLSVYSPPFGGLYCYSSDVRDMSNSMDYGEFFEHYRHVIAELHRIAMPGRMTAVHCMDIPAGTAKRPALTDFSGDIIRAHQELGWQYVARYAVWKEPLGVRRRTMVRGLTHATVVEDASRCSSAAADYLLVFRAQGENSEPITNPNGFLRYAGERQPPSEVLEYKGWPEGKQVENRYSHWIWRQYASAFWDDIRLSRVLPFEAAKDDEDEKHVHPLQLDVIDRIIALWSNEGETVFTPFMGVGSEVWSAVKSGRRGVGVELKPSYYRQAVRNLEAIGNDDIEQERLDLAS